MMEPVIIDEETDSGGESYFLEGIISMPSGPCLKLGSIFYLVKKRKQCS